MISAIAALAILSPDFTTTDLKDGFVKINTDRYSVEVPKKWRVSAETSFGQRYFRGEGGSFGAMTGSSRGQTWEDLYRVSLFFIKRSTPGEPTPFKIVKTKQGFDAMSFSMLSKEKLVNARYLIFKNDKKEEILALNVRIMDRASEAQLESAFKRMVESTVLK